MAELVARRQENRLLRARGEPAGRDLGFRPRHEATNEDCLGPLRAQWAGDSKSFVCNGSFPIPGARPQPGTSPFLARRAARREYFSTELDNSWSPCVTRDDRTTVLIVDSQKRRGEAATETKAPPSYEEARVAAWILTGELIKTLDEGDANRSPGTHAWLEDCASRPRASARRYRWQNGQGRPLHPGGSQPELLADDYEIAPGDPMLTTIHAGLLLSQGEAMRAAYIIELGKHRPGVPKEFAQAFRILQNTAMAALKASNTMTEQGTQTFDRGDYDGAIAKYREALVLCPQNGWTSYELGYTLRTQAEVARGEKPGKPGTAKVNGKSFDTPDVTAAFAESPATIRSSSWPIKAPIRRSSMPAWSWPEGLPGLESIMKRASLGTRYHALKDLSEGFQEAGVCDLAILTRQLMAARRNSYDPEDYPIIAASLHKLRPARRSKRSSAAEREGASGLPTSGQDRGRRGPAGTGQRIALVRARQAAAEERREQTGPSGLHPACHFRRRCRPANDSRGPGEV